MMSILEVGGACVRVPSLPQDLAPSIFPVWICLSCGCCLEAPKQLAGFIHLIQVPGREKGKGKGHIPAKATPFLRSFPQKSQPKTSTHILLVSTWSHGKHTVYRLEYIAFSPKKSVFYIKEDGEKGYWFGNQRSFPQWVTYKNKYNQQITPSPFCVIFLQQIYINLAYELSESYNSFLRIEKLLFMKIKFNLSTIL